MLFFSADFCVNILDTIGHQDQRLYYKLKTLYTLFEIMIYRKFLLEKKNIKNTKDETSVSESKLRRNISLYITLLFKSVMT